VGDSTSTVAAASRMSIDATQFVSGADMCAKIALACAKLGASMPNYPNGATIDARGFTGDQLCAANNITTMLSGCVTGTGGHNGGKLLLGNVHLYADGPVPPATSYSDGTSGIGTPALIIPSFFWGIEGISRGTGDQGDKLGTFISVCTTSIGLCNHPFPVRSFTVNSATVGLPVNGVTTMTINVSPAPSWGVNIYPGELAMMKGNTLAPTENGMYKIQNSSGGTIQVTVPAGTPQCIPPGVCGTLFLGTPIVGFGGSMSYNNSACLPGGGNLCSGFGEHIKNLGFNCQAQDGCIGWQNLYTEEESNVDTFVSTQNNFVAADVHNPVFGTQNFGPILNAEIYTGTGNANCDCGTTGIYIGDAQMRGVNGWTIVQSGPAPNPPGQVCGKPPIAAVLLDAPNTEVINGHCEGFSNCVLIGANNAPNSTTGTLGASGDKVSAVAGATCNPLAAPCDVVHISKNYPNNTDYVIQNIRRKSNFTNTIVDDINGVTIGGSTDGFFTGLYSWGSGINNTPSTNSTNLMTTDVSTVNQFGSGLTASFTSVLIANNAATAPVVNKLVKLTGSPGSPATATLATTADTSGSVVGICLLNCSTTGSSTVVITGVVGCMFGNATTAGDWAIVSTGTNGDCKDTPTVPSTLTDVGRVLTSGALNTVQNVLLQ